MAWHVYVARCGDGTLYTGITTDPARRESAHNAGRGASYTRARRPVRLVHLESAADRGAALRRELAIKRLSRPEKERLVMKTGGRASGRAGERAGSTGVPGVPARGPPLSQAVSRGTTRRDWFERNRAGL